MSNACECRFYLNTPLISTEIHQHLAPLPLHILLGTTKKVIDIITDMCIHHDTLAKNIQGYTRDDTSLRDREILSSIRSATQNIQLFTVSISTHQHNKTQAKKSSPQWHDYEKAIWEIKRLKKKEEQLLAALEESWTTHAGPFIHLLDSTITSLHVKRQRYHDGAFGGNDCIGLLKGANQLAAVLTSAVYIV